MTTTYSSNEPTTDEHSGYTTIKIDMPKVPKCDDPATASEIANYVMARTREFSGDLQDFLTFCHRQAPKSTQHGHNLDSLIRNAVMNWLFTWPE